MKDKKLGQELFPEKPEKKPVIVIADRSPYGSGNENAIGDAINVTTVLNNMELIATETREIIHSIEAAQEAARLADKAMQVATALNQGSGDPVVHAREVLQESERSALEAAKAKAEKIGQLCEVCLVQAGHKPEDLQ